MPGRGKKYMKVNRQVSSLGLGFRTVISLLEKQPREIERYSWVWWCVLVNPAHGKLREEDCSELQTHRDYIESFRPAWAAG